MLLRIALIPFSCAIMQCLFAIRPTFIRQEISFGKKFHSVRNFIRQQISFGTKFHSARIFIRHEISFSTIFHPARIFIRREISFGKKFHSARNFIRHGTQKPKFDNRKRAPYMGIFITVKTRENSNSNMADRESFRQDRRRANSLLQEATRLIGEEYES